MELINYIPDGYKEGFKELYSLDGKVFDMILEGLASAEIESSIEKLAAKVTTFKELNEINIDKIFSSVGAMIPFLEDEEDIEQIAKDIEQIIFSGNGDYKKDVLKDRVIKLLTDKKIFYCYKVNDLILENGNVYMSSRLMTDFRPVFDLDLEIEPTTGLILHNLRIHYQDDIAAPHKDIYLSLTPLDVADLMNVLMRADDKASTLSSLMSKLSIKTI
jgi:hypothetical protein